ncbi:UDP-galactopyranose mutase [Budviciaceae bacterium CWB-B4]|uniref:UDP-galactopyranose mutase n=1 Tax=Limnobaculum xujianqingii TaxID=2738837 RepID=A0A9D7AKS5_9GAMM|nr:UDP-galactopyranose mutase [Limnobaculum xujianqingii]MBK5074424.1 UDP-galactopyranose mutase [Limnobaculum xujianqingii]MBK5177910.1 UDP-galactopyranose mutase [Limnobaculum xujianqingii]
MYDYIIVGAGLFGAVCANKLHNAGKRVLVIEKRSHIGGNAYTEDNDGIHVHKYGAHIFHTNDKEIWEYVNSFAEFNRFTNSPLACYKDKLYNLPFNMNTFYQLWGVKTPLEAQLIIDEQKKEMDGIEPKNLEEQAILLVGRDVYEILIKGYTEKQWGRSATSLPPFIIKRIPFRMTYDNNYFSDRYQGIPIGGYTRLIQNMLDGVDICLNFDFLKEKESILNQASKIIYTGPIDEYFDYKFGPLEYRSIKFEHERYDNIENYQGNAVINYTERSVPYTRIIEHKHFEQISTEHTIITKEYPAEWRVGDEPYYPVNDEKNMRLFKLYRDLSNKEEHVIFGGRLAEYKYYDMHQVIRSALQTVSGLI